jgi:hypothetical protein
MVDKVHRKRFIRIVNEYNASVNMKANDIEITVDGGAVLFTWNDEAIQEMAEALGEPEFSEPRPCG